MKIGVVGCSFAGLSFSYFVKNLSDDISITLFDRKRRLGDLRTSACCTNVKTLKLLSAEKCILKKFNKVTLHYKDKKFALKTPEYATFDYRKFCEILGKKIEGKLVLNKSVYPIEIRKDFDLIIDSRGWISKGLKSNSCAFGIEKEVVIDDFDSNSFHIFVGKNIVKGGYGWVFPVSRNLYRVGIGSYEKFDCNRTLSKFLRYNDCVDSDEKTTGGYIPYLFDDIINNGNIIFLGDSISQTFPLTFEGIRPTVFFSKNLAQLVKLYSHGRIPFEELINNYKKLIESKRTIYKILLKTQGFFLNPNDFSFNLVMEPIIKSKKLYNYFSKKYFF